MDKTNSCMYVANQFYHPQVVHQVIEISNVQFPFSWARTTLPEVPRPKIALHLSAASPRLEHSLIFSGCPSLLTRLLSRDNCVFLLTGF